MLELQRDMKDRIIVAIDLPTADQAIKAIDSLEGEVGAFKIGLQLFSAEGPSFIRQLVDNGTRIFLDVKYHDIPITVAKAAVEVARLGVWMFNVHILGGSEMIRATVDSVSEFCEANSIPKPKIIGVTVLTSANQATLSEIGIEKPINEEVISLARIASANGLDGVVASPIEAGIIRKEIRDSEFNIVSPGIRPSEAQLAIGSVKGDDQKRIMTPKKAIENGSDYLVIGRPILNAVDPKRAVRDIVSELEETLKS